jgi:drug/metabolite transporter (DMT)-like permease
MLSSALLFAVITFILWGTTNFLISYGEKTFGIKPELFSAIMWMSIGALGAVLFAYLYLTDQVQSIGVNAIYPVAAGLLLGIGILSFAFALSHTELSTGATAAVATSNAVFTTLLAFMFLKEGLDLKQWVGILTVVTGIIILRI